MSIKRCEKIPNRKKKDCQAKDAACQNCTKTGHYAVICRTNNFKKSVRHIEHEEEEEFTLESVSESKTADSDCIGVVHDKEDLWRERIMTPGKPVTYRVDTGADVTVMPDNFLLRILP